MWVKECLCQQQLAWARWHCIAGEFQIRLTSGLSARNMSPTVDTAAISAIPAASARELWQPTSCRECARSKLCESVHAALACLCGVLACHLWLLGWQFMDSNKKPRLAGAHAHPTQQPNSFYYVQLATLISTNHFPYTANMAAITRPNVPTHMFVVPLLHFLCHFLRYSTFIIRTACTPTLRLLCMQRCICRSTHVSTALKYWHMLICCRHFFSAFSPPFFLPFATSLCQFRRCLTNSVRG